MVTTYYDLFRIFLRKSILQIFSVFSNQFYDSMFQNFTILCSKILRIFVPKFYEFLFQNFTNFCSKILRIFVPKFYEFLFQKKFTNAVLIVNSFHKFLRIFVRGKICYEKIFNLPPYDIRQIRYNRSSARFRNYGYNLVPVHNCCLRYIHFRSYSMVLVPGIAASPSYRVARRNQTHRIWPSVFAFVALIFSLSAFYPGAWRGRFQYIVPLDLARSTLT